MTERDSKGGYASYLSLFPDGLVDDIVVLDHLLLHGVSKILEAGLLLLQVDVAEPTVEQHFARVQLEQETQLRVVDHGVSSEVEQSVVEVRQGFLKIAQQEVGDTLLEVGYSQVLIETNGSLVTLNLGRGKRCRVSLGCYKLVDKDLRTG